MVRFVYSVYFRIVYFVLGVIIFCFINYFLNLENIQNPWYILLWYMSLSFVIHGGFSVANNGFQNASVYMFGAFSWVIALIFTAISLHTKNNIFLYVVLPIEMAIQICLFVGEAPEREEI